MTNVRLSVECYGNTEKELMNWKEESIDSPACVTIGLSPEDSIGSRAIMCRRLGRIFCLEERAGMQARHG